MGGISDLSLSNQLSTQDAANRARLASLTTRGTTSLKASVISDIAPQYQSLGKQQSSFSSNLQYIDNAQVCTKRLESMEAKLNGVITDFATYRSQLADMVNGTNPANASFNQDCLLKLQNLARCLNGQDAEGRNLFGDQALQGPVCDLSKLPAFTLGQPASLLYAVGDNTTLQVDIDDNQTVPYGVTAFDPAFAEMIQCLQIGATTVPNGNPNSAATQLLRQCMTTSSQATLNLGKVTTTVGENRLHLMAQEETLKKDNIFLQRNILDVTNMNDADLMNDFQQSIMLRKSLDLNMAMMKSAFNSANSLIDLLR